MRIRDRYTHVTAQFANLIDVVGGRERAAEIAGVGLRTISDWKRDPEKIKLLAVFKLLEAAQTNLSFFMTSEEIENLIELQKVTGIVNFALMEGATLPFEPEPNILNVGKLSDSLKELVAIPKLAQELSAGSGQSATDYEVIEQIPFSVSILQHLGRKNANNLVIFSVRGDSMEPTCTDGTMALVDMSDTSIVGGLYAILVDGEARIKRLRKRVSGQLEIISDNSYYPTEMIEGEQLNIVSVIGRVRWLGRWL